ncbi:MAG: threonine--tRNA ligase [Anaerolineales bacterium]
MSDEKQIPYEQSELYKIRHSAAHIMAQAVMELFEPDEAKIAIGPPIADGFYYDFDLPRNLTQEDLDAIEKRMRQIIAGKYEFKKEVVSAEEAKAQFKDQPYKIELIEGLEQGGYDEYGNPLDEKPEISFYTHDSFTDLCRGPHVENTGQINPSAFKLMNIAGAYWRGDEHNPQLQRVYGTAWKTKEQLKDYLWQLEEAKKRDHRKLGKELDLFTFDDEVGPGLPLWTPRGTVIIEQLEKLAHEVERRHGYSPVRTPHLTKEDLFIRSGHLPYYEDTMYPPMELEGVRYFVKPMNCPMHHKIFASQLRSYRDMPIRLGEYGTCYRYEKSGELFGLMRVRSMQMNDAHIYCSEAQFEQEFMDVIASRSTILMGWAKSTWIMLNCGLRRKIWCAKRWIMAECPMWKQKTKPLSMDRRSMSRFGAPSAASFPWLRTRWILPSRRASTCSSSMIRARKKRRCASIGLPSARTSV